MPSIRFHGSRADLIAELYRVPRVFAGMEPDRGGVVEGVQLRMGMVLQGRLKENFVVQSAGGIGALNTGPWPPLSPKTLSLRRRGTVKGSKAKGTKGGEKATYQKLQRSFAALPEHRKNAIIRNYGGLQRLYSEEESAFSLRKHARFILEKMRPNIAPGRYQKLKRELSGPLKPDKAERLAFIGAHAEILRDTGRLLNTFSPELKSPDMILTAGRGVVTVGENTPYGKYHQSAEPRKLKADGTPRLPRRQFLPDDQHPVPAPWWADVSASVAHSLADVTFWRLFMGSMVA
jgi:hypothetical protein